MPSEMRPLSELLHSRHRKIMMRLGRRLPPINNKHMLDSFFSERQRNGSFSDTITITNTYILQNRHGTNDKDVLDGYFSASICVALSIQSRQQTLTAEFPET